MPRDEAMTVGRRTRWRGQLGSESGQQPNLVLDSLDVSATRRIEGHGDQTIDTILLVFMRAERWTSAIGFIWAGVVCVIAGGLVSASTAPSPSEHGSWAAAYLVLVGGVAQVGLGVGQAWLAPDVASTRLTRLTNLQLVGWNVGNAAVIGATLSGLTPVVDAGGALLVATLVACVSKVRHPARRGLPLQAFRALVILLLVSIPVGLVLAQLTGD